jgi:hypothetical protein
VRCATYSAHSSWQCEMRCAGSAAAQPIDACRCSHLPPSPTPMSALRAATAAANSFFGTACQPNRGPLIAACTAIFGRLMARGLVTLGCLSRGFPGEWAATHAVLSRACLRAKRGKGGTGQSHRYNHVSTERLASLRRCNQAHRAPHTLEETGRSARANHPLLS